MVAQLKMLSEAQAWREIARRIAEGEWDEYGLCAEIDRLAGYDFEFQRISDETEQSMNARVKAHMAEPGGAEDWPYAWTRGYNAVGDEATGPRILACYLLALEVEDERRAARREKQQQRRRAA